MNGMYRPELGLLGHPGGGGECIFPSLIHPSTHVQFTPSPPVKEVPNSYPWPCTMPTKWGVDFKQNTPRPYLSLVLKPPSLHCPGHYPSKTVVSIWCYRQAAAPDGVISSAHPSPPNGMCSKNNDYTGVV